MACLNSSAHLGFVKTKRVAPFALGPIKGEIGKSDELIPVHGVVGSDGDAQAQPSVDLVALDHGRSRDRLDQIPCYLRVLLCVLHAVQDREFVTTEPSDEITVFDRAAQTGADPLEQLVA